MNLLLYMSYLRFMRYSNVFLALWVLVIISVSSNKSEVEWLIKKLQNISYSYDEEVTLSTNNPLDNYKDEIPNVTCITEKLGLRYQGIKSTTEDGMPCIEWRQNLALYTRYKLRGKNITKNYCRNPDNDSMGPWCFVEKRSIIKKQIKFKSCGIPLCIVTSDNFTKTFKMGVPMLLQRDCPKGFKLYKNKFCIVEPDFLDKLPNGSYALQPYGNRSDTNCYAGFREEEIRKRFYRIKRVLCSKESQTNGTIDFPGYISPNYGELIFMAISLTTNCPAMMSETSLVIKKTTFFDNFKLNVCYYFYKLSKNKYIEDKRLAFLTFKKDCPDGWKIRSMEYRWKFIMSIYNSFRSKTVSACVPENDSLEFPDGNYCLLSFAILSPSLRCPKDFIKVTVGMTAWQDRIFCCRESINTNVSNINVYNFFNYSSVLIINNGKECAPKDSVQPDIKVSSHRFEAILYDRKYRCENCDLVKTFNLINTSSLYRRIFSKAFFTACNYERITNGFAYASINSRCPPEMEYAYIKYAMIPNAHFQKLTTIAKFCTKINYPVNISFPQGRYCIYKIGFNCPPGFINSKEPLPLYSYKNSDSNGNLPNYNGDSYCCKNGTVYDNFENITLPYVTSTFEFGLPFPNDSYSCVHGLSSHSGVEDSHMCEYYPTSSKSYHTTVIFPSDKCRNPAYTYYGPYRLLYLSNNQNRYCYYYVKNSPPPGKYCIISAKNCPRKYFYYVTYHPLSRGVICCRIPIQNDTKTIESSFTLSDWVNDLKEFDLLPYKGECQVFKGYNYGRRPLRVSISYKVKDIGVDHLKNLTDIGIKVIKGYSYTVWIESCIYKMDPFNKSSIWPHGNYAFPKTLMDCPSDFKNGYFTHSMESASPSFAHSDIIHLDGDYMIGGTTIKWGFCVKKDYYKKEKLSLPHGRYCLMKVGKTCPKDFKEGSVKFVEITAINNLSIKRKGDLPEIENDGPYITYHFCCQSGRGDIAHDSINLPIDSGPFYLFKFGSYCQKVEGMRVSEEFICIDSEDSAQHINYTFQAPYKVEGFTPITGSYSRGCDFQINLCYYDKDSPNPQISTKKPKETQGWPKGSYVFVKSLKEKCPPLFSEGKITVRAKFKIDKKVLNTLMLGNLGDKESILSYCERNSSSLDSLYPPEEWPKGVYCVIFEKKCPQGMLRYKFKSINNFVITVLWENLCCKKDNLTNIDDLPFFPADQYSFIILPTQEVHSCPAHKNMRVALINLQSEILCYYEKIDENIEFPSGDYLLPAPWKSQGRCSPGFKLVKHYHSMLTDKKKVSQELTFCQKERNGSPIKKFPRGNYCILTTNYTCPSNQFTEENILVIPLHQFFDQENKLSQYLACCQNDDRLISNLAGMKVPFQMFASTLCSFVDEMVNANEAEETTILQQRGVIERPPFIKSNNKIRLCRYDQASLWNYDSRCQCHKNAACFLTFDDVKCRCKSGFFGDGKTICSKITNSTDRCGNVCNGHKSQCVETTILGIYKCRCKEGYEGDGFNCKPSCNMRTCGVFSHCVVNSLESYCECIPKAIRTLSGSCNGDLIKTTSLLSGFDVLNKLNLSCFSNKSYQHLISPKLQMILFIFIPPNDEVFTRCENVFNYYSLVYGKIHNIYKAYNNIIQTESGNKVYIKLTEKNQWTVNINIKVLKVDIFTNAIVLYLNESITSSFFDPQHAEMVESKDSVIAGYTFGILAVLVLLAVGIVFLIKRNRLFSFNRLNESRSETNIHFFSSENKIEIDT